MKHTFATATGTVHVVKDPFADLLVVACSGRKFDPAKLTAAGVPPTCKRCVEVHGTSPSDFTAVGLQQVEAPAPADEPKADRPARFGLSDLLEAGLLRSGQVLVARYLGVEYSAEVDTDGRLVFVGDDGPLACRSFGSPSSAAQAIKVEAGAKTTAANGWTWWKDEQGVTVGELRDRARGVAA